MDWVEGKTGKRHAFGMVHSPGKDLTACGRVIETVARGGCIPPLIECKRCRERMQNSGLLGAYGS